VLGLLPQHWGHLAGISGGEKIYLGSRIVIKNYPAHSAAIGGRDGMDGGKANWMTLPFWEEPSKMMLGFANATGLNGPGFSWKKRDILLATVFVISIHIVI